MAREAATPKATHINAQGTSAGQIELPASIFGIRAHRPLLHQALIGELANSRTGTHSTKTRGEVRGGGRKPWRQKGTGRARAGSRRSPVWVGGGITFGPSPRDHGQRMPRMARSLALRAALSAQAKGGNVVVLDPPSGDQVKTRLVASLLKAAGVTGAAIVVAADAERALARAASNIRGARVMSARRLSVRHLLVPGTLVITKPALAELQEALG
jgi:large subunit ribosomal protein L4